MLKIKIFMHYIASIASFGNCFAQSVVKNEIGLFHLEFQPHIDRIAHIITACTRPFYWFNKINKWILIYFCSESTVRRFFFLAQRQGWREKHTADSLQLIECGYCQRTVSICSLVWPALRHGGFGEGFCRRWFWATRFGTRPSAVFCSWSAFRGRRLGWFLR